MEIEKRWISSEDLFSAINEFLLEDKQACFTVTGNSMWPFLAHGRDQVVVEKCDIKSIKKGDIVLFKTPYGKYLLHRVTHVYHGQFESCGDNVCVKDGIFDLDCIVARVVTLIRKGKKIQCDSLFWKFVFRIWMICFPVRKYILFILRRIKKRT